MQRFFQFDKRHASLALALSFGLLTGCGSDATPTPQVPAEAQTAPQPGVAVPANVSIQTAASLRNGDAFILDVREPAEWNEFHMPDSTLIPLGQLASRVSEVPKDRPIVVICRSGSRSQVGRDMLLQAGWTNVASMDGGLTAWQAQGLPVVSGP